MEQSQIYEDYHMKVLRYIQGQVNDYYLAEDLCSDVFMKVYEKLESFNEKKASISTWIFTITKNTLIDYYRTRKVTSEIPENLVYEDDESDVDDESLEKLAKGLENLDERSRNLIIKHYYEGKTLKEVAEELGISYAYSKILHQKALFLLKKYMK